MAEGNLKITLVGLGNAGRAVVGMLLATRGRFDINIQDPSEAIEGTILDLKHAAGTNGRNRIFWNDREQFESSDFVVHTPPAVRFTMGAIEWPCRGRALKWLERSSKEYNFAPSPIF